VYPKVSGLAFCHHNPCVVSQRVFIVVVVVVVAAAVVYFVIDSVRKLLDTPSYLTDKILDTITNCPPYI
jgi:hypothetical protein